MRYISTRGWTPAMTALMVSMCVTLVTAQEPLWHLPVPQDTMSSPFDLADFSVLMAEATAPPTATAATATAEQATGSDVCCVSSGDAPGNLAGRLWFTADYLLLWTNGNPVPPLLTTNPTLPPRSQAGVLGVGDTQTIVGGRIDEAGRSGVALTGGYWLDCGQCYGVQATWWYAGDPVDELRDTWASAGVPVLARPFFNVGSQLEDSQLVAYPNVVAGSIEITSGSDLRSFETLLSANLHRGCQRRFDLLGGYRYFRFQEGLYIEENLVSTNPSGVVQIGTTINLFDQFNTSNSFHGGTIGLLSSFQHGWLQLDVATKLGVGNVRRQLFIDGRTVVTTPNSNQSTFAGGLLALPSNMGSRQDDAFGLLPELNLQSRILLTDHLTLNVGYNLLFLTNVYRSGEQIDRAIDPGLLAGGMPINGTTPDSLTRPAPTLDSATLCVQGLNLGCTITY
jgi:hypothetical protein